VTPRRVAARDDAPGEAAPATPAGIVLVDVSANLLCLVVVFLALTLATGGTRPPPPPEPPRTFAVPVIAGPAAAAPAVVDALFGRTTVAPRARLDLLDDGILATPAGAGPEATVRLADGAAVAPWLVATGAALADVFVFDHRHHAGTAAALATLGIVPREVSPPAALTAPSGGFSADFGTLYGRDLDPAAFRAALARLLAGEGTGLPPVAEAPASPGVSLPGGFEWRPLAERLAVALRVAGFAVASIALVVLARRLSGRPRRSSSDH